MKFFLMMVLVFCYQISIAAEIPFHRGVNLSGWFQESNARKIQLNRYSKENFIDIKNLGCDVIRLPVNLHAMILQTEPLTVDPIFLFCLDYVLDITEELNLHLIIDNHSFDPAVYTSPLVKDTLIALWPQIAAHCQNRSKLIYYEILNEPSGIADSLWNEIQQLVINSIREIDTFHTIIVGPSNWNSYHNLKYLKEFHDDNLIYTFHFYDPFLFTHQGASWADPSLENLKNVPFPHNSAPIPVCPDDLKGTWAETALLDYYKKGSVKNVEELLNIASDFSEDRNVPLFCGEFGVFMPNSPTDDRVFWHQIVREIFEKKNISWTLWEYHHGFGLFNEETGGLFPHDLNIPLVEALGLNPPLQSDLEIIPDKEGFSLYSDLIGSNIIESSWQNSGEIDYFHEQDPVQGRFCLYWTEGELYSPISFSFIPTKDLSWLKDNNYYLDFWVKGNKKGMKFDIRFVDTISDSSDLPWRSRITIDSSIAEWNSSWNHIQISLKDFTEHGAWNGSWHEPQGDFDWKLIQYFQIVAEYHSMENIELWFDEIKLISSARLSVNENNKEKVYFSLMKNYPNPFYHRTFLEYNLYQNSNVCLDIYNISGSKVDVIFQGYQPKGKYIYSWEPLNLSSGIYFYRLKTDKKTVVLPMIFQK